MPAISMFYGILILMYFRDNRRHHIPPKQLKMVQAWIEIHKEEFSLTGSWLSTVTNLFELRHFSEVADVD